MSADARASSRQCRVVFAEKLAANSGGAGAICAEVERALNAALPQGTYDIQVKVVSPARLSAAMVVNGRRLPEQNLAVSDRNLSSGAIRRFARALGEAAKAAR